MTKRRRFKQTESLTDRLAIFAKLMRERAAYCLLGKTDPPSWLKAEQAEKATLMDEWIRSSELKPPR